MIKLQWLLFKMHERKRKRCAKATMNTRIFLKIIDFTYVR